MTPNQDESLQRLLDKSAGRITSAPTDVDAQAYQKLYEALDSPPTALLSPTFATEVTARLVQYRKQQQRQHTFAITVAITVSLFLSLLTLYYTSESLLTSLAQRMLESKEIVVFAAVMLVLIQLSDRWLVKRAR